MNPIDQIRQQITRRHFFKECGVGVGKMALASLLLNGNRAFSAPAGAANPLAPRPSHFPAKAKHVIYLFQGGAPSQLDLFDYKPMLVKYDGQPIPPEVVKDQRYAFIERNAAMLAPRFKFAKHGQCGAELSEMLPHLSEVVDEIAIIKSMHTDQFNHAPAQMFIQTGSALPGRPSFGSWATYGLGSEAEDLPAFVVLVTGSTSAGASLWSSGFMPTIYQGVNFRTKGDAVLGVSNPRGVDNKMQRESLDLIKKLNEERLGAVGDPEIASRINSYEMAYRMQSSAPELMDLSKESPKTLEMYGVKGNENTYARCCLLARRLVERGVRFVQIYHEAWDHHSDVSGGVKTQTGITDKPSAALIKDLKQRGLLDETLVIWGGEFGRTPMVESNAALGRSLGRDHHPQAFTLWLAGAGVKKGFTMGQTDELGFHVVKDQVHVHDLQATALHLLGLDHKKLTYFFQGRDYRLTDVHGELVRPILA